MTTRELKSEIRIAEYRVEQLSDDLWNAKEHLRNLRYELNRRLKNPVSKKHG